jgi:peptide/nickel transport system substrate-binding protein
MMLPRCGVLLACLLVVVACDYTGPKSPRNGGTLNVAIGADPATLNRFLAADSASLRASAPLFPNLYQANPDLSVSPDLAESMPVLSSDRKQWTVRLRRNARWSDGRAIVADDVISTVAIQRNPALVTDVVFDWTMLEKVEKVDDRTVRFTLTQPYAPFLANSLTTFVAPAHIYGPLDVARMAGDPISRQPVVTGGPFKYEKRSKNQVDLSANVDYYAGRPHLDRIVLKIVPDPGTAASAVANGDLNWEPDLGSAALLKLQDAPGATVRKYPDLSFYDVRFNDRPDHLFGDRLVRQAFAHAIDKAAVVKKASGGNGFPMWGDVAPQSWAYEPGAAKKYRVDLVAARQLMQQAGWQVGADGIAAKAGKRFSAKFYVRSDAPSRVTAVGLISTQARAIGMELLPTPVTYYNPADKTSFFDPLKKGDYDIAFTGFASGLDPDQFRIFHSSQLRPEQGAAGFNWTGYSNPALDKLIEQERTTVLASDAQTRAARRKIFSLIEKLLSEDVVTYFMWAENNGQAFSPDVGGIGGQSLLHVDNGRNVRALAGWYLDKP